MMPTMCNASANLSKLPARNRQRRANFFSSESGALNVAGNVVCDYLSQHDYAQSVPGGKQHDFQSCQRVESESQFFRVWHVQGTAIVKAACAYFLFGFVKLATEQRQERGKQISTKSLCIFGGFSLDSSGFA
jgi:hypothetical protein